jgi:hypothetical protein
MNGDATPMLDLVARTFRLQPDAISREAMDHDWAPVERWHLHSPDPAVPQTVVVKTRRHNGSGWGYDPCNLIAERRALELLGPTGLAPRVYAASDEIGVIVMEDIAGARTVEQVLFGADPAAARDALARLATAFGAMHAATAGLRVDAEPWNPTAPLMQEVRAAWDTVIRAAHALSLPAPTQATAGEIAHLDAALTDPAWRALTHGDAFPSNTLLVDDRTVLIDFEGANPRHIAIDGAGFALAFPAYRYWADLSEDVIAAMTGAWRAAIEPAFPSVANDAVFWPMLATGALAWTIARLSRLPRIADDSAPMDESRRRRSQIVHMTALAVATCRTGDAYPSISAWLGALEAAMRERWPEASEPRRFPCFNGGSREGWTVVHDI